MVGLLIHHLWQKEETRNYVLQTKSIVYRIQHCYKPLFFLLFFSKLLEVTFFCFDELGKLLCSIITHLSLLRPITQQNKKQTTFLLALSCFGFGFLVLQSVFCYYHLPLFLFILFSNLTSFQHHLIHYFHYSCIHNNDNI